MVLRANFGIYDDRIPLRAISNALQRDGSKYKVAVLPFGYAGAPLFPATIPSFPNDLLASITTMDPGIESGNSQQAGLQVERELFSRTILSVGYTHLRGLHIIMSRNVNVPTLSAADAARLGVPNLGRPDPLFANISRYEAAGDSYYNGMSVSINRRMYGWAAFRVSYTLSKAIDTAGNFFFSSPQNSLDIRDDRGLSANDQRHRLVASGSFRASDSGQGSLPRRLMGGFELSYIFSYGSPYPFNIQTGTDRNNDTNVNDRPVGVGRDTGVGFGAASLDLRLSRRIQLAEHSSIDVMVEAFNVTNHVNLQFPNNIYGSGLVPLPSFGLATAAGDPRQVQFGLRISF
jgi:hypothetical protein